MEDKKKQSEMPKAYLAWTKQDFIDAGEEVPEILINNEDKTEAELMSDIDLENWVEDTATTFGLVKEQNEEVFNKLYQGYILDVEYLVRLGRIDEDTADELLDIKNFEL